MIETEYSVPKDYEQSSPLVKTLPEFADSGRALVVPLASKEER